MPDGSLSETGRIVAYPAGMVVPDSFASDPYPPLSTPIAPAGSYYLAAPPRMFSATTMVGNITEWWGCIREPSPPGYDSGIANGYRTSEAMADDFYYDKGGDWFYLSDTLPIQGLVKAGDGNLPGFDAGRYSAHIFSAADISGRGVVYQDRDRAMVGGCILPMNTPFNPRTIGVIRTPLSVLVPPAAYLPAGRQDPRITYQAAIYIRPATLGVQQLSYGRKQIKVTLDGDGITRFGYTQEPASSPASQALVSGNLDYFMGVGTSGWVRYSAIEKQSPSSQARAVEINPTWPTGVLAEIVLAVTYMTYREHTDNGVPYISGSCGGLDDRCSVCIPGPTILPFNVPTAAGRLLDGTVVNGGLLQGGTI